MKDNPTITKGSLTRMFRDEPSCGIIYREDTSYLPTGDEFGKCTNAAWYVVEKLGRGEVYGFWHEDMKKAHPEYYYRPIDLIEGHDFAVIDNRYIVDLWLSHYTGDETQVVYDMREPKDAVKVKNIYGHPDQWKKMSSYENADLAHNELEGIYVGEIDPQVLTSTGKKTTYSAVLKKHLPRRYQVWASGHKTQLSGIGGLR